MPPQIRKDQNEDGDGVKIQEILYDGYLYNVTSWIKSHPGGSIIKFYTEPGEDATIPIQQFHKRSLDRVLSIMKHLPKRKVVNSEWGQLSSETLQKHAKLDQDFATLEAELRAEGYFEPSLPHIIYRFGELALLLFLGLWCISSQNVASQLAGVAFNAMFGGRSGWFMHEGGHHSITGRPKLDRFFQSFLFGFGAGLSATWWSNQHNRHHSMPNRLHRDVDLDTMPLLAFNKAVLKGHASSDANFFIRHQSKLFAMVDTLLVVLFWKLYLHPKHAFRKSAHSDVFFIFIHYFIALQFGVFYYLLSTWLTSIYIFVNFSLSHTHLPVTEGDEKLHWIQYALLHTVDIDAGLGGWVDWWMCYLNYQVEHHLWPTMPQFRHPQLRRRVEALAARNNLPYHKMSYWEAVRKTFENLDAVSRT